MQIDRRYHLRALRLGQRVEVSKYAERESESRSLVGEAAFDDWLAVGPKGTDQIVPLVQLSLSPQEQEATEANRQAPYTGALSVSRHDEVATIILGFVSVILPHALFEQAWEMSARGAEVWLHLQTTGHDKAPELKFEEGDSYAGLYIVASEVGFYSAGATPTGWLEQRRVWQLNSTLRQLYIEKTGYSQVARVCKELATGLARIENFAQRVSKLQTVVELIADARTAFREPLAGTGEKYLDNAFTLNKPTFEAFMLKFDKKRQDELRVNYDHLWQHFNLSATVRSGEDAAGPAKYGLRCSPSDLDEVAVKYFGLGAIRSPTLEWALLSALTYSECLGFAQLLHSDTVLFGGTIPVPLKPMSTWEKFRKDFKTWVGESLLELLKLGLSFAVAWTITLGEPTAAWVVMTGYTSWRWLRKVIFWRELTPKLKPLNLLSRMEWVSESFKRLDYNPEAARQSIHALMREGASFSPWVLNLLDRQVKG